MLFFKKKEEIKPVEKKFEIVSLGVNCLPRTLLTRKNLKPRKAQGELSCPFDLVFHEPERITHYIENDFANYFDDLYFSARKKGWWDFRKKGLWKKDDGTRFFHDKDCKINDREKLVNRVSKRMDNFRKILENEKPIIFVQALKHTEDIENLYNVLKKKRGNKPFKLAILDFNGIVSKEYENISVFKIPYPNIKKYEAYWNKKRNYDSQQGRIFEENVKLSIEKVIDEFVK